MHNDAYMHSSPTLPFNQSSHLPSSSAASDGHVHGWSAGRHGYEYGQGCRTLALYHPSMFLENRYGTAMRHTLFGVPPPQRASSSARARAQIHPATQERARAQTGVSQCVPQTQFDPATHVPDNLVYTGCKLGMLGTYGRVSEEARIPICIHR